MQAVLREGMGGGKSKLIIIFLKIRQYMEKCFVIQPFDDGKYDKRYVDIFEPAISASGLEPYRIDKDLNVRIPIEDIEKGIYDSYMCFAEITTNNPNVWYELGYAFACGKDVVMVCSEERQGSYPFDIQHRQIIKYNTNSISDFETLKATLTKKITLFTNTEKTKNKIIKSEISGNCELEIHEINILDIIVSNQLEDKRSLAVFRIKSMMKDLGFREIATMLGIQSLEKRGLLLTFMDFDDFSHEEYSLCKLTEKGENWIYDNKKIFQLRFDEVKNKNNDIILPF
jgi:hypothetical protein